MNRRPALVWFRRDLRVTDNASLTAASATGRPLVACFVLDDRSTRRAGAASRWWLHRSLVALSRTLEKHGGRLVLRSGPAPDVIPGLAEELDAAAVFASALPDPAAAAVDANVGKRLAAAGRELHLLPGALLFGADPVRTGGGRPFQVFTPFARACLALPEPEPPVPVPDLSFLNVDVARDDLEDWHLEPRQPNWAAGFEHRFRPGEQGAHDSLDAFVEARIDDYPDARDRPAVAGTSGLSAHLAFGELSPRQAWHAACSAAGPSGIAPTGPAAARPGSSGAGAWLRQLIWREFACYLLHHFPAFAERPFRAEFERFPWAEDAEALGRWQAGITGYPIVDAGMRELWQTGWMHNRVRMIVASFLVKDLLIPWQQGEAWFWDTLLDADPANNAVNWQWVAGSGADAAPYFRIFNPVLQGRKFDPGGAYVRRYVPEIAALPDRYLHAPWTAPARVREDVGVILDLDYPAPIVDHGEARKRALAAWRALRDDQRS